MKLAFLGSIFAGCRLSEASNHCHVLWVVHGFDKFHVDVQRELNEAVSNSEAFKKNCGSSRPNWKEYKLPDSWKGESPQELETARQEVENMLYDLGKSSPYSNIFIGGSSLAAGLAIHTSLFFSLKLAGVIAIDPVIPPTTTRFLEITQGSSTVIDGFGQTRTNAYYTTKKHKEPLFRNLVPGSYDFEDVAATMEEIFNAPKCAVIFVTDDSRAEPVLSKELLGAFAKNEAITARCGASPVYDAFVVNQDNTERADKTALDRSEICRKLGDHLVAASNKQIPNTRKFLLGQGTGRQLIDECQSVAPTTFKDVTIVTVETYEVYWLSTNSRQLVQGVMNSISRALSFPPAYPGLLFAYKTPEEAVEGHDLERGAQSTAAAELGRVNSLSVILPDIGKADPPDNGRGTPLWMVRAHELASRMAPLSSVTLVARLRYSEATIGVVADNLGGTFVYQVDPKIKAEASKGRDKQRAVIYRTENEMKSKLPKDLASYMSRSMSGATETSDLEAPGSGGSKSEEPLQMPKGSLREHPSSIRREGVRKVLNDMRTDEEEEGK
ncbi:hypothetical protein FOL47_006487 [Perkinsus chesapeaki]|uniref:Uncharacterized protein n=1 Tax=Perkinsus chesapeaki TaxID=330153 RepID=A0A7J6LRU7_PERCH|nr:hypothetical protein FOL47_006487 [Perkinsus chesapeaki]